MMQNKATKVGTPYTIWKEYVRAEVHASDADLKPYASRLQAAYNAGEPVWMMADELKHRLKYTAIAKRADADDPLALARAGMREHMTQECIEFLTPAQRMIEQVIAGVPVSQVVALHEAQARRVADYIDLLMSRWTQSDMKGKNWNKYALVHQMGAIHKIEDRVASFKHASDPESLQKLIDAIMAETTAEKRSGHGDPAMPGYQALWSGPPEVIKTIKDIENHIATGRGVTLPSGYGRTGVGFGKLGNVEPLPGWSPENIKIALAGGPQEVMAFVKGGFAVNTGSSMDWSLTHIHTGFAFLKSKDPKKAMKAADEILAAFPGIDQLHSADEVKALVQPNLTKMQAIIKRYR
jgi:hypothetical protein